MLKWVLLVSGRCVIVFAHFKSSACARMVLDAVHLTLAKITTYDSESRSGVVMLTKMELGIDEGAHILNHASKYEAWLSGKFDYTVLKFEEIRF